MNNEYVERAVRSQGLCVKAGKLYLNNFPGRDRLTKAQEQALRNIEHELTMIDLYNADVCAGLNIGTGE